MKGRRHGKGPFSRLLWQCIRITRRLRPMETRKFLLLIWAGPRCLIVTCSLLSSRALFKQTGHEFHRHAAPLCTASISIATRHPQSNGAAFLFRRHVQGVVHRLKSSATQTPPFKYDCASFTTSETTACFISSKRSNQPRDRPHESCTRRDGCAIRLAPTQ